MQNRATRQNPNFAITPKDLLLSLRYRRGLDTSRRSLLSGYWALHMNPCLRAPPAAFLVLVILTVEMM